MSELTLEDRIKNLEAKNSAQEERSRDLEAGIVRMASYLGVLHVLKDTGPK